MAANVGLKTSGMIGRVFLRKVLLSGGNPTVLLSRCFTVSSPKLLYTPEALGINGYVSTRERTATQLGSMKDRFKTRMEQYLSADAKSLIFTEDLKNMLYLAETDADLDMVERMMKKFVKQNEQLRFGSFVFGPVVMRMFYHLDKPELALKTLNDAELTSFFDQITSYQLLMDSLYNHKRYNDVIKVYQMLKDRPFFSGRFPKETLVLAVAACYKLGTPEASKIASTIVKSTVEANQPVQRKAVAFAAALAIKTGDYSTALETLAIPQNQSYVTIRNLKALALYKLDRLEDVLPIFRSVTEQDSAYRKSMPSFFEDVVTQIKEGVAKKGDKELQHEFDKVFASFESGNHIDKGSMDEFLERPIEESVKRMDGQMDNYQQGGGGLRQPRYRQDGAPEGGTGGYQPRFQQDGQQQVPREPRYQQDGGQQRSSYQRNNSYQGRQNYTQGYNRGGAGADSFADEGAETPSRGSRGGSWGQRGDTDGGYNANAEAGYKPRTSYNRRSSYGGGDDGGGGGYSSNAEAGYKPRVSYNRSDRSSLAAQRQGLKDLDD